MSTEIEVIETGKTLSNCILWGMLEDYYKTSGLGAWDFVPFYPTCNAFIGEAYAEAAIAFLLDMRPQLHPDEPVYFIEMAAGSGLFGFYMLRELAVRKRHFASLEAMQIHYVMTDFTENNVAGWEQKAELKPFIDANLLDFAVFRPETDTALTLRRSQKTLAPGTLKNPLIAVANYFFDSIRQDFFHLSHGQLEEARLTFTRERPSEDDPGPPTFEQLKVEAEYVQVPNIYYSDPRLNRVLDYYGQVLPEGSILFPVGAFQCIQNLQALSGDNLMLLSTDKGFTDLSYMGGHWAAPYTPHHGVISFMVNYNAISRYFLDQGGYAISTFEHYALNTTMCVLPKPTDTKLEHTRYYLEETLKKKNPITNLYAIRDLMDSLNPETDPPQAFKNLLALIHLSNFDSYFFARCGAKIFQIFSHLQWYDRLVLEETMYRVEQSLHPASLARYEVLFILRQLYYELDKVDKCMALSLRSIEQYGPDSNACYYAGACHEIQQNFPVALDYYRQALDLNPQDELMQGAVARMESRLGQ